MNQIENRMGLLMGLSVSFLLSLVGTLSSGAFTIPSFLISFLISFCISTIITKIIPIRKVTSSLTEKLKQKPGILKYRLVETLISDLLMSPLMTFVMVCIAFRQATAHGARISFWPMLLRSEIISFIAAYLALWFLTPLLLKMVLKNTGITQNTQQ